MDNHQHCLKMSLIASWVILSKMSHTISSVGVETERLLKTNLRDGSQHSSPPASQSKSSMLNFLPSCPDWVEMSIAEEPQATHFKDAEHVASSWTIEAYQTFRRVQTAGWWSAWSVPLQTGLHFKVTRLNLLQYRLQKKKNNHSAQLKTGPIYCRQMLI